MSNRGLCANARITTSGSFQSSFSCYHILRLRLLPRPQERQLLLQCLLLRVSWCQWSRASTFNYNRNAIGLAVAYVSAIRTHLLVHGTAHPMSAASVRPRSAADCLIRSVVDISHPRQQGNPSASSSAASGPVRSDIINGLGACTVGGGWQSFAGF